MLVTDLRHDPAAPRLPDIDELRPGIMLAAVLDRIDVHSLSGHDRIRVLRARQRMASHYAARLFDDMVSVLDVVEEDFETERVSAAESASAEIQAALNLTRRASDTELSMALDLHERLPAVWQALASGVIDPRRARAIAYCTSHLNDDVAGDVAERILREAPDLTTGQIMARIRRLAIEADPDAAHKRYERSTEDRRVVVEPTVDGAANLLGLDLPPGRVAAATRRIDELARSLSGPDEDRTMDQLRADVLLGLLDGSALRHDRPAGGNVDITVDLATLAELRDEPGELAGYGPIVADVARRIVRRQTDTPWTFTVTDRPGGRPVFTGITRRRPGAGLRRTIVARFRRCVFPGCRMPARRADIDHRRRYADGGPTSEDNLAPLCWYHHGLKDAGWSYDFSAGGDVIWTSPLRHTYTVSGIPP